MVNILLKQVCIFFGTSKFYSDISSSSTTHIMEIASANNGANVAAKCKLDILLKKLSIVS